MQKLIYIIMHESASFYLCKSARKCGFLHLESEVLQVLLDLFFEVVAFRKHFGEFAGEAGHFLLEGFVVLHGVFDADVAAWSEDVVLLGNVCDFDYGTEAFFVLEFAFLEFFEGAREAFNVLLAEVAVLAVHHVAHVACVNEERLAFLLFAAAYKPECDGDGDAVEELGGHGDYAFDEVRFDNAFADFAFTAQSSGNEICFN